MCLRSWATGLGRLRNFAIISTVKIGSKSELCKKGAYPVAQGCWLTLCDEQTAFLIFPDSRLDEIKTSKIWEADHSQNGRVKSS